MGHAQPKGIGGLRLCISVTPANASVAKAARETPPILPVYEDAVIAES